MNKTFVITDIHGCFYTLKALLDRINYKPTDTLIFLGDSIDRGPYSKEVLDLLIDLPNYVSCVFLMGNHEEMLLNVLNNLPHSSNLYFHNGGMSTMKSFGVGGLSNFIGKYRDFLDNLQLTYELPGYLFVHAGIGISEPYINPIDCLWIRELFIVKDYSWLKKKIVFGHTPFKKPLIRKDKIGLDTGCVFGHSLSCLVLPEEKIISIKQSPKDYIQATVGDQLQ